MASIKCQISSKVRMVDITEKKDTKRQAIAQAQVSLKSQTIELIKKNKIPKGDVLSASKIAGIMAAKKTPQLIPLCHPLQITEASLDFKFVGKNRILIESKVSCIGKTGVEMEALTAASIAALTIYDMCKPVDRDIIISDIKLLKKTGGKSGDYERKD